MTGFISKECRSDSLELNSFVAAGAHERESSPCPSGVGPPASSGELAVDSARPRHRASPDSENLFPLNGSVQTRMLDAAACVMERC